VRENIGVFGGTFNPVHSGHLHAAEEIMTRFRLDKILFIPSYIPPHKRIRDVASAEDRMRMVELAVRGRPGFVASEIEVEARETSYSVDTLERIKRGRPEARIFFILGVDAFLEIGTWREYERVIGECRFIVMARPGFLLGEAKQVLGGGLESQMMEAAGDVPVGEEHFARFRVFLAPISPLDISSTDIRRRIRDGVSVEGLVPEPVHAYLKARKLYQDDKEPCLKK
jgi:nicotinate-nucleotide adenylyltransferase